MFCLSHPPCLCCWYSIIVCQLHILSSFVSLIRTDKQISSCCLCCVKITSSSPPTIVFFPVLTIRAFPSLLWLFCDLYITLNLYVYCPLCYYRCFPALHPFLTSLFRCVKLIDMHAAGFLKHTEIQSTRLTLSCSHSSCLRLGIVFLAR